MLYSPLRYPGGKAKMIPFFQNLICQNNWEDKTYIEPFAGGANVALSLLIEGYIQKIIINDADHAIYSFWHSILKHPKKFIQKIKRCNLNLEEWHCQKRIFLNPQSSELDLGFAAFYLNRTNFSGVLSAGPLGGLSQNGPYKLDARFTKETLINKIKLISGYEKHIIVTCKDAIDLIKEIQPQKDYLIYFDPPYYVQGRKLYTSFYQPQDHEKLATLVQKLKAPCIVTYDNVPAIKQLYAHMNTKEFSIQYSANRHVNAKEVMFYQKIPNIDHALKFLK